MSYDFPDGPDYNPEPIDDDPWNVDTTSHPTENQPPDATDDDLSATDDRPDL